MSSTLKCPVCGAKQPAGLLCHDCTCKLEADLRLIAPGEITVATDWRALPPPAPDASRVGRDGWQGTILKPGTVPGLRTSNGDAYGTQTLPWERQRRSWAGFDAELQVTLARLDRHGTNLGGGRASGTPMPFSDAAGRAARELRTVLLGVRLAIWDERVDRGTAPGTLIELTWSLAQLADWILERVNRVRAHDQAADIMREITGKVGRVLSVIGAPPPADVGRTSVTIRPDQIEDALASKHDILQDIAPACDVQVSRHRFGMWLTRGRLWPKGEKDGHPLYRVGDVLTLARAAGPRQRRSEH